jgi:DNA ligase 1
MLLSELVDVSAAVAASSGRLDKVGRLAEFLRRVAHDEIPVAIAFLSGELRQGRIGVGGAAIWQTKAQTAAATATLQLREVDELFDRLATVRGSGSSGARLAALRDLLARATAAEQDFLIRLLFGELRQGALEGVLLDAVAKASAIPAPTIRRAAMMAGGLAPVARAALVEGESGLAAFGVRLFQPIQPMLAQPAADLDAALGQLDADLSLEWKIDGARIQVHKGEGDVRIFSRTLRDVTSALPDVVDAVRALPARDAIFDGEVIALQADGTPHPFQVTMSRFGRKLDVEQLRATVPLTPFLFDCVYADGTSLVDLPQAERVDRLAVAAPALVVPRVVRPDAAAAAAFLDETLRRGHEGVMAKGLATPYAAGRRGQQWLKIKIARTLDLVVLAAEWGHGRRHGWLSNLHLGARDPHNGGFVMLGKTFKGMTDEMLTWQTGQLLAREIARDDYTVYVRPELVVEVAFNEIQESSQYPGGLTLRFARVKAYRDKPASEADTIDTIREWHRRAS